MSRYVPKLLNETSKECSPINRDRHTELDMSVTLGLIQPRISSETWRETKLFCSSERKPGVSLI